MLETLLSDLRNHLPVKESPLLYEHELITALYALTGKIKLEFTQCENGAVPLFKRGYFPWGPLPYPQEHAEFGLCLAHLGKKEAATKLAAWQLKTIDHNQEPIFSFFSQEGKSFAALKAANSELFSKFPHEMLSGFFYDEIFSFCGYKSLDTTILSFGTGCKSGMGFFLHEDAGIVNFGPQKLPLTECASFGLAGRPKKLHCEESDNEIRLSYLTAVSAPHQRKYILQDSGFSGVWLQADHIITPRSLFVRTTYESLFPLDQYVISFYGKGEKCVVEGRHILRPKTFDHYEGPATSIEFRGKKGKVILETEGCLTMKIIPLAGGDCFWGADFLVSYTFDSKSQNFRFFT